MSLAKSIRAIIFDCDGVLLESTAIKTHAFKLLFEGELPRVVDEIVAYHLSHTGVNRYDKFQYIYASILKRQLTPEISAELGRSFGTLVREAILQCPEVRGLRELLDRFRSLLFFVASATPEPELRDLLSARGLLGCFDGVWGSPATKEAILSKLLKEHQLDVAEVIFVGDAANDRIAAERVGVRFIARRTEDTTLLSSVGCPVIADLRDLSFWLEHHSFSSPD